MVNNLTAPAPASGTASTSGTAPGSAARLGPSDLDRLFGALASPARRAILRHLAAGPQAVHSLAAPLDMSAPAVSKHLKVLEAAALVARERRGRVHRITLRRRSLGAGVDWLHSFWEDALDTLAASLEPDVASGQPATDAPPGGGSKPNSREGAGT